LIELLDGVQGAIIGVVPMTEYVLKNSPSLKVVSMHGVGVDHIDLQAAANAGVVIANCLGSNDKAVADLALGLMISIAREIPKIDLEMHQGLWGRHKGSELWNKTLGLIGLGYIGRGVAKRALGFDMKVLVHDPYITQEDCQAVGANLVPLETVIAESDFLSLHAPLNNETKLLIGSQQLDAMKESAYLINTARGDLVDEAALYKALTQGKIAGAAMDVYTNEPPDDSPLLELDNIVVTAHIVSHTLEAIERMGVMAAENVLMTLAGGEPHYRVV